MTNPDRIDFPDVARNIERLKAIETRCADQVCSVHGHLTAPEIALRDKLRVITGFEYDAINRKLIPFCPEGK